MDTPKIYVACLASYNNGILHGRWIEAIQDVNDIYEEIHEMLARSTIENSEEFAVHDYEGFFNLNLDEYENISMIAELARFISKYGDLGAALLSNYSLEKAENLMLEGYYGAYESEVDFAQTVFEECYNAIPENLRGYFDYKAYARDLFISDFFAVEANNKTHVFSITT